VLATRGSERAGAKCKAHPFTLEARIRGGLVYLRIGGDFDRATVGRVESTVAAIASAPLERLVFDLSGVTFMDQAALSAILLADHRARTEGYDVVVVRPPALGGRVFTLSRAGEHLMIVDDAQEAGVSGRLEASSVWKDTTPAPIRFRRLVPGERPTCVRCRSNPAIWQAGQVPGGPVTLDTPEGSICGGCVTRSERIELGEAILGSLRDGHAEPEGRIKTLEDALAELPDTEGAD
jgi:anti-anti-sigma factor